MKQFLRSSSIVCLLLAGACGGGSGTSTGGSAQTETLQLQVCSLGCSGGTCSIRELPINGDIEFTFSDNIDPTSVTFSSIQFVNSANGGSPTGAFLINGNRVVFRPSYSDTSEGIEYGFREGATYALVLESAPLSNVVRTTGGRPNQTRMSCTFTTSGVRDFVPGPPSVSISPNALQPPVTHNFPIELLFNDVIRSTQLVAEDGSSPTVDVSLISEAVGGQQTVLPIAGSFAFMSDTSSRTSTLTFTPTGEYPSGENGARWLRVGVSNQVSDLAGNRIVNPGEFEIPLLDSSGETGVLVEPFSSLAQLDDFESAPGVWTGSGFLDSTLNPTTGAHSAGGSAVFGVRDTGGTWLDTGSALDAGSAYSELLQSNVDVSDSVFMFRALRVDFGDSAIVTGELPARLFVRGSAEFEGALDLSGEDAPVNFGFHRPFDERLSSRPSGDLGLLFDDPLEAVGGAAASARLGGAAGGVGGAGWYTVPGYYDDSLPGWYAEDVGGPAADPARHLDGISSAGAHGANGGLVGGADAVGAPIPAASAAQIASDLDGGAGMGSWAWPPKGSSVPLASEIADGTWVNTLNGDRITADFIQPIAGLSRFEQWTIMRARGGGGGGYWTDGERGDVHMHSGDDVGGERLAKRPPDFVYYWIVDGANFHWNGVHNAGGDIRVKNQRLGWPSYLLWDDLAGRTIEDGQGGRYRPLVGGNPEPYYSLDPALGYLRGGSGGGGAGNSQFGSFNIDENVLDADREERIDLETLRDNDGAGGGAGGGALQLHIAGDLTVSGEISVAGGAGGSSATVVSSSYSAALGTYSWPEQRAGDAGGGGGSGGSLLLQVGRELALVGSSALTLSGGLGGEGAIGNHGGDGGAGALRVEGTNPFTLADAAGVVEPVESYDLSARPEYGLTGENFSAFVPDLSGTLGDVVVPRAVGLGTVFFNGNSTGVTSNWMEGDPAKLFLRYTDYEFTAEWSDGVNPPQTIVYNDSNSMAPGTTPVWVAFQTAFGFPDESGDVQANPGSEYGWVIPGYNTVAGGAAELAQSPSSTRLIRFQLTFDQDLVAALIGNNPAAYFRVTQASFDWVE